MSCMHCVGHVKEALQEISVPGSVEVNLEGKYAVADTQATNEEITALIDDAGYDVVNIEG